MNGFNDEIRDTEPIEREGKLRYTTPKEEVKEAMKELLQKYMPEEVAIEVQRSTQTIWRWVSGKAVPSKGDMELLRQMVDKIKKGKG